MRRNGLAGVITLLLLVGAAACGGDDKDGGLGARPAQDQGDASADGGGGDGDGAGGSEGDPCSLLEVSEIKAEFGDRGAVAEGEALGFSCSWEVGDLSDTGSGAGSVGVTRARSAPSAEEAIAEIRDLSLDPVEVEGLGDEALFDFSMLWFRSGDVLFSVSAFFNTEYDNVQEKLLSLAHRMLDRA